LSLFAGHFSLSTLIGGFLKALNDEGQQQMVGAWQQEAPEEPEARSAQEESEEVDDQPRVTYGLVEF
jgi:hypothetical protein